MLSTLKEFLYELSEELRFLPAKQVNEILKHYRDKVNVEVDYGADEEKVISETTEDIQENLIQTLVKQAKKEKTDIVELLKEYVQVEVIV